MNKRGVVQVLLALIIGIGIGHTTSNVARAFPENPYIDFDAFASVITTISTDYVEPIPTKKLVDAAINGMVTALDPHSAWIDAGELESHRSVAPYVGIGVEITRNEADNVIISTLHKGGPAARDGLRKGDQIISIEDSNVTGMTDNEIATLLNGQRGESVRLQALRGNTTIEITTLRDVIDTSSVTSTTTYGNIGYVKLSNFEDQAANDLHNAVNTLRAQGMTDGLLLDLRDNGGGLLEEAVAVVDLFIDAGLVVTTESRVEGSLQYHASPTTPLIDLPLVVLVNNETASAAEVVAGALKDYERATLIGAATFGKRSVQTLYETQSSGALKLTIGRYYPPSGAKHAANKKIQPNISVVQSTEHDSQLQAALSHF